MVPVPGLKFPVRSEEIPVQLLRELAHKYLTGRVYFGRILAKTAKFRVIPC
jgi:hypothetical protein